jgi:Tol biopolymer transport system component
MRRLLQIFAVFALLLHGCNDRLPSSPDYQDLWKNRGNILFTEGVSADSTGTISSIRTDGSGYAPMQAGLLPATVRNGKIVYVLKGPGPRDKPQLFIANRDGSGAQQVALNPTATLLHTSVAFSPDGEYIAYIMFTNFLEFQLYAAKADGSSAWLISNRVVRSSFPVFSPIDDTRLAFYDHGSGSLSEVHVADLSAVRVDTIARNAKPLSVESLDWSPDGTRLAYVGLDAGTDLDAPRDIFIVSADGLTRRNITRDNAEENHWPVWSPDGTRIAFIRNIELWTMNADGGDQRQVTRASQWPYQIKLYPQWSPDGSMILFTAGTSVVQGVLQVVDLRTLRVNALAISALRGFWVD